MIAKEQCYYADVELKGDRTRGQLVLSRIPSDCQGNIRIIKLVNIDFFKTVILAAANRTQ